MIDLLVVEDNPKLRSALVKGLERSVIPESKG